MTSIASITNVIPDYFCTLSDLKQLPDFNLPKLLKYCREVPSPVLASGILNESCKGIGDSMVSDLNRLVLQQSTTAVISFGILPLLKLDTT